MAIKDVTDFGGPDPIQGFDVDVWVQDQSRAQGSTSNLILLGSFTSIVVTIRNATEAYLELNQRVPRYLDGEVQMAWVMEKGMLDLNVLRQTFGFGEISRNKRFNRSPRFQITFNVSTYDELKSSFSTFVNGGELKDQPRTVSGRIVLDQCKVDSWHFAATSGKQVVATQWQGVCESIKTAAPPNAESVTAADTSAQFPTA